MKKELLQIATMFLAVLGGIAITEEKLVFSVLFIWSAMYLIDKVNKL